MYAQHNQRRIDPKRLRVRMVCEQLEKRGISDPLVLKAMSNVPRHQFLPDVMKPHAYDDRSIPIGFGQTISQPFTVAKMLQYLEVKPGMRVLEIGMGSGYQAAVLSEMGCKVFAIERLPELYRLAKSCFARLAIRNVYPHLGDGTLGLPVAAPFDRIIVAAGGPEVPRPLLNQLEEDGIMLIPVGPRPRDQELYRFIRKQNQFYSEKLGSAVFVNLVGEYGW